jgi:hypothetical protein
MEAFEGQNWGNVKMVEIALRSEVNFWENQKVVYSDEISFNNGGKFTEIPFILESAFFTDQEENSSAGLFWSKKLGLKIPKLRSGVSLFLQPWEGALLVARVTDMNGEVHLVFPLRMQRQRNIQGTVSSLNHTLVEFAGQAVYESPVVVEPDQS